MGGALAITLLLQRYTNDIIVLFVMAVIVCSFIEYFTSYFMEKKYHARWWDYSNKKFNINGRMFGYNDSIWNFRTIYHVCVKSLFIDIYNNIPDIWLHIIAGILFTLYIIDNIVSSRILSSIHGKKKNCRQYRGNNK